MKKLLIGFNLLASLCLVACGGQNNGDAQSSTSSSLTSSSEASSQSSSNSVSNSSSSSSSSSLSQASSSSQANARLQIEEGSTAICRVDGDPNENKNLGFSGSGYANADNAIGASIVWAINASESGRYQLQWRFANGGSVNRDGQLILNDGASGQYQVNLAVTGAWTNWQTVDVMVDLVQGNNVLELKALGVDGLANIDWLSVNGADASPGDCSGIVYDTPYGEVIGDGRVLSQAGNPAQNRFNSAKTKWSAGKADIILSYQLDNGGWPKNQSYDTMGNGGSDSGTFDNNATVTEMVYLAQRYKETGDTRYRDAVRKAMNYTLTAQYDSGGWPQFYPLRGGYSDHATFNDNAMASVLTVLHNAQQQNSPFDGNIFSDSDRNQMATAITKGVDYILKAQWLQNGVLTVWCAQHGATDYQPKAARAYELVSLSGSESVEVLGFLMTQPQTVAVETAVKAGLAWFRSESTKVVNTAYVNRPSGSSDDNYNPIRSQSGSTMWYRFYDLYSNRGFFSDRDGGTYYDIMDISAERRYGYSWGGNYGSKIISYAQSVGY